MRRSLGWLAFGLIVLSSPRASAWCRTTTRLDFTATDAQPCDLVGLPVFWKSNCADVYVSRRASVQVDLATARQLVAQSFATWAAADCPDDPLACGGGSKGPPSMVVTEAGATDCGPGYERTGGNVNEVVFHDDVWPHPDPGTTIALTTLTFRVDSGEILDADIEIDSNPERHPLSTGLPTSSQYDLLSVLTHEAGHVLGLAHTASSNAMATMAPRYEPGDSFIRDLERDDVCGVCAVSPPGREATCTKPAPASCGGASDGGVTADGGARADGGTTPGGGETECNCTVVGRRAAPPLLLTLLPVGALLSRRRRRTAAASRTPRRSCS